MAAAAAAAASTMARMVPVGSQMGELAPAWVGRNGGPPWPPWAHLT